MADSQLQRDPSVCGSGHEGEPHSNTSPMSWLEPAGRVPSLALRKSDLKPQISSDCSMKMGYACGDFFCMTQFLTYSVSSVVAKQQYTC